MGYLWPKYIMFELKNCREALFDGTEYWCKIWNKTDFCFQKWHEEFSKFSAEHLKVSKLGLWWDSFIQCRKCMSLKFTGNLLVMTVKKRCKIVRGSDLLFQIWHEDFDEFWLEHLKISKLCTFMRCLWAKYITFELKNYRGDIFNSTEGWCKIWRKIDLCFRKWHEEFAKFLFTGWKIVISF